MNHPSHIEQLLQQLWSQDDKTAAYEALQQLLRDDPASAAQIAAALAERPLPGELPAYQRAEWDHLVDAVLRMDEPMAVPQNAYAACGLTGAPPQRYYCWPELRCSNGAQLR
ncbi:hypothetical protein MKQ70_22380 [Chitinophaga sedimenti]|uniref:hypothetical protein n=1 Tax=Chitinophaga sedimenti TaxID=2033606 RepID=UPI002003BC6C|nr:hypothetical protein [Chitinophaga sedimenti]MCK7557601.1 hypothetical protein [Chitinophaga sedimenti]